MTAGSGSMTSPEPLLSVMACYQIWPVKVKGDHFMGHFSTWLPNWLASLAWGTERCTASCALDPLSAPLSLEVPCVFISVRKAASLSSIKSTLFQMQPLEPTPILVLLGSVSCPWVPTCPCSLHLCSPLKISNTYIRFDNNLTNNVSSVPTTLDSQIV